MQIIQDGRRASKKDQLIFIKVIIEIPDMLYSTSWEPI